MIIKDQTAENTSYYAGSEYSVYRKPRLRHSRYLKKERVMIRKIIQIDEEKCNGCGACANACHEGAIAMVDGKAKLIRDDYCDGLGNCLPACPTNAISFIEREAAAYDEAAVAEHMKNREKATAAAANQAAAFHTCPGSAAKTLHKEADSAASGHAEPHFAGCPGSRMRTLGASLNADSENSAVERSTPSAKPVSRLAQWPCQIKLVPVNAPYFNGAKLLIAADCTAYAYANVHEEFMKGRVTIIGCPKLDEVDYSEKLQAIIENNDIKSVTVLRMEVPCCGGLEHAAVTALKNSGKFIPWQVVTFTLDGHIRED